jgi:copper(I)-binding protein
MRCLFRLVAVAVVTLVALPVPAHDYALRNLRIEHPSARATPPGARSGGVYFTIQNLGKEPDRLMRVASPAAASVELHSMTMDGTLMKMRPIAGLDIPAGAKVTLGSAGLHVMLVDLKQQLAVGDRIPMTLTFEKAGTIDVSAWVEPMVKTGMGARDAAHPH